MPRQARYSHRITFGALLALLLLLAACDSNTTAPTIPDAQQIIGKAQTAIQKATAYHFNLTTDNPGTGSDNTFTIKSADGDLLSPDKLKAKANVLLAGFAVTTEIVAVGNNEYYQDPLSGKWTQANGLPNASVLTDPQTGLGSILGHIQHPSTPTASSVDGNACWSIDGKLDTQYLTAISAGNTPAASSTVATNVCIGKNDYLPYQLKTTGIAFQGDTAKTVHTLKLSKFNESVTIDEPKV